MGFFDLLRGSDINQGIQEYHSVSGSILLDVRTPEEYKEGHIPGSLNIPLQEIQNALSLIPDKDTPLFVCCFSGARSSKAVRLLKSMGYTRLKNIGGLSSYRGKLE